MGSMARQLRLFLIRHGETVDNVAQVYAGSRDSALTNHGYQQATRLGLHLKGLGLNFTHIFSSHLQRAAKTAGKIREAQVASPVGTDAVGEAPEVVQLPAIMEQDFGSYEGKLWYERAADSNLTGKEQQQQEHEGTTGFVDMESKESMARRVDVFLDSHLLPLLDDPTEPKDLVVAVVSHGIILSVMWKRLVARLPPRSVAFSPEVLANARSYSLEHLGAWSNTGYLELHMQKAATQEPAAARASEPDSTSASAPLEDVVDPAIPDVGIQGTPHDASADVAGNGQGPADGSVQPVSPAAQSSVLKLAHGWKTTIQTVNGKDHLNRLKRTGGGLGSARHDTSQKNIDSFFKRARG